MFISSWGKASPSNHNSCSFPSTTVQPWHSPAAGSLRVCSVHTMWSCYAVQPASMTGEVAHDPYRRTIAAQFYQGILLCISHGMQESSLGILSPSHDLELILSQLGNKMSQYSRGFSKPHLWVCQLDSHKTASGGVVPKLLWELYGIEVPCYSVCLK